MSTVKTSQEGHIKFNVHRHQCRFPGLVEHLQVVVAKLCVQEVVHASGSPRHVVDPGSFDLESDLSSSQHRDRFLFIACLLPPGLCS